MSPPGESQLQNRGGDPARPPTIVSCIIERRPRELLIVTNGVDDDMNRQWEFPTGVARVGEAPEAAMRRTTQELLNLAIDIHTGQPPFTGDYQGRPAMWRFFLAHSVDGKGEPVGYATIRWIPTSQLREYDFAPVYRPVVEWYLDI